MKNTTGTAFYAIPVPKIDDHAYADLVRRNLSALFERHNDLHNIKHKQLP